MLGVKLQQMTDNDHEPQQCPEGNNIRQRKQSIRICRENWDRYRCNCKYEILKRNWINHVREFKSVKKCDTASKELIKNSHLGVIVYKRT